MCERRDGRNRIEPVDGQRRPLDRVLAVVANLRGLLTLPRTFKILGTR